MKRVNNQARVAGAQPTGAPMTGRYLCPELRPFQGRPGAMDAFALPSRVGNRLHYPGGRVTDLQGQPISPTTTV